MSRNCSLTDEDCVKIVTRFSRERTTLPAMFVATASDRSSMLWTKTKPSVQILLRMKVLAEEALRVLNDQMSADKADFKVYIYVFGILYFLIY